MVKFHTPWVIIGLASLALVSCVTQAREKDDTCSSSGTTATNLVVCSASYLGGSGNNSGTTIGIAPDRSVVVGGKINGNNFDQTPIHLKAGSSTSSGGNGVIVRMSPTGRTILSVTRLGDVIDELDINRQTGQIAVVGDFGLAVLNSQANQVLWSKDLGSGGGAISSTGRRVGVGQNGEIAAFFNKQVTVFDKARNQIGQFTSAGNFGEDVAIDSRSKTVIVTGFSQKNGGECHQLQVAFIRGYSYTGKLKWQDYDWTQTQAQAANSSCADTRGLRVAIGKDNMLYFAGESAGGNSIYNYDRPSGSQKSKSKRYKPLNLFMEKEENMYFETRSARNTTSILQSPKFIYGVLTFDF